MRRSKTRLLSALFALFVGSSMLAACAVNPATGRRELSFIGESQEIAMGREADPQIVASLGLYPDSAVQRYVRGLGEQLAAASERPDLPWTFRVLDDPTVNAFALPGGYIYVTRGIMTHLTSEAELVGILGHEIGHVTAKHSVNQMSRQQLAQLGLGVGMIVSERVRAVGDLAAQSLGLLFLKYGRDDEREADMLGFRYMTAQGYDPSQLANVFEMLNQVSAQAGQRIPEWLSTHPDPGSRSVAIGQMIAESGRDFSGAIVREPEYMQTIDGVIFGANPREGYFEDAEFFHPDLRFALTFPSGWQTVNQKQAVQGMNAEQDAIVALTLAEGSANQARNAFMASEGITTIRTWEQPVGGLVAAWGEFAATTQDGGTLRGTTTFVEYEGNLYRLIGYAPRGAWAAREQAVRGFLFSFRSVSDPAVLGVRPDRVRVVRVGSAMTVQQFMQNYPSRVPEATISLINQIAPDGSFVAGRLAKQIVQGS
jgi:predicted Zn-dependent protease